MIDVLRHHLPQTGLALRQEMRIAHLRLAQAAGMPLLPDQQTVLVAQVEKTWIVRIMAGADAVATQLLHHLDILHHGRLRYRTAEGRIILVPIEAL